MIGQIESTDWFFYDDSDINHLNEEELKRELVIGRFTDSEETENYD